MPHISVDTKVHLYPARRTTVEIIKRKSIKCISCRRRRRDRPTAIDIGFVSSGAEGGIIMTLGLLYQHLLYTPLATRF